MVERAKSIADLSLLAGGAVLRAGGTVDPINIIEWVVSDQYLNRPMLYPRQALILKIMFLQDQLFTQYDYDTIGLWEEQFARTGQNGIPPGTLDRIKIAQSEGRPWFRETVGCIGRRGGKGYIGGLGGSYVLWEYMKHHDPQEDFGIAHDKRMSFLVFGGKKEQAKSQQWRDLVNVILGGPIFQGKISRSQTESLTLYSNRDINRRDERIAAGIVSEQDIASFEILPKESTPMAGRGPASFAQIYDEMAHVTGTHGASAEAVYEAATPSLDQFGVYGWIYAPSSPWQQTGKFFELYNQAIEMEDGLPVYPDKMMFQLTSWDIYEDWERAHGLPLTAADPKKTFRPLRGAVQAYDEQMQRLERANPETFAVERRSHFAMVADAYLNKHRVDEIFNDWMGEPLRMKSTGALGTTYIMHGDPSKSGANFGLAIAHAEPDPAGGPYTHVVFDYIHHWQPQDFEYNNYEIDYISIEDQLKDLIRRFIPAEVSFDQYNSVGTIQRLRRFTQETKFPRTIMVFERTATNPKNWAVAECFKTAIGMGLVHAPYYEQASQELKFLQSPRPGVVDHPDTGPVVTKDVADCLMIVTHALIGDQMAALMGSRLGSLELVAGQQGGFGTHQTRLPAADKVFQQFSAARGAGRPRAGAMPIGRGLNRR